MACDVSNIKIEPVNATWEIEEQTLIKTVADVSDSLDGTYFTLSNGGDSTKYYVWMDGVAVVDPAPAGRTSIPIAYSTGDSAATIAGLIQAAVDALGDFGASVSGDEVTITNAAVGDSEDVADVDTGFSFTKCADGGSFDLGLLDGDVEVSFEIDTEAVVAHQTGSSTLADLIKSTNCEVAVTMKETDKDKLKEIFSKAAGGSFTPSGGTEVFGWGSSRIGSNTVIQSRRLRLHPVRLDDSIKTDDFTFYKSWPIPDSLVFSGETTETIGLSFRCYHDRTNVDPAISLFGVGDSSQVLK